MKSKTLILGFLLCCLTMNAQQKVKEVVTDQYDRNSVSFIMVDRNDYYQSDVNEFYNGMRISEKFDINVIPTRWAEANTPRPEVIAQDEIDSFINRSSLGHEIISYIYNRKADGSFDDKILTERGLYNAVDQEIINTSVVKVADFSLEMGESLINSAYVIVLDFHKLQTTTSSDNSTTYNAYASAYAYKLEAGREVLDEFYMTAWADATSTEQEKENARKAFDRLSFRLTPVATVTASGSSSGDYASMVKAMNSAYGNIVYELENSIPAWQTATTIISTRPLAAKIGTKEGVKNGSRFQAYSYKEDREGNLKSVKQGMVRATVVANNTGMATGHTNPTLFYQISGPLNIKEGYVLKQKNDMKLGATFALGISPAGFRVGVDLDYIANIAKRGSIVYPMVNIGLNFADGYTLLDTMVGVGYGIPVSRFFEVTPYATVGGYTDIDTESWVATAVEPGVRLAITFQPIAIVVSGGYQLVLGAGDYLPLDIKAGLKYTF